MGESREIQPVLLVYSVIVFRGTDAARQKSARPKGASIIFFPFVRESNMRRENARPHRHVRDAISMSRYVAALLFLVGYATESVAQPPPGYYGLVDTTSAATLRATVHEVIDDHTRFPYTSSSTDTWDILEEADEDPSNTSNILDLYRNTSLSKQGGGNSFYNREHSWPKSYGFPDNVVANYPYTDCHALFLCDSTYNSSRSNKPYRFCSPACSEKPTETNNGQGGGTGVYPGNSNWTSGQFTPGTWETWIGRRGDVARALFYLDVRYEGGQHGVTNAAEPDLVLTDDETRIANSNTDQNESVAFMGMLSVLLQWHEQDPVDDLERHRNDVVFTHQGNRNPFIDHPEWVRCIFANDCGGSPSVPTVVWINEIHYENLRKDVDEFVEVAGPASTDLTGWMLIGYNGATGSIYRTIQLSGVIPDQGGSTGTLAFDFPRLQNGSPDGVALVDANQALVEFISYEGAFSAINGPAAGTVSTDIGVAESNSTPLGQSLQRHGIGSDPSLLTWQTTLPNTRGQPNTNQSF